ncbi:MAG: glycosyltransferase family 87 protein [Candidatus Sigynarchaeota archaeon]
MSSYILFAPALLIDMSVSDRNIVIIQIGSSLCYSFLILLYPVFFRKGGSLRNPLQFLIGAFFVKMVITVILQLLGVFPGNDNFITDYEYGRKYLYGQILDVPGTEYQSIFYYPPGCSLFFVFLYLINPAKSPLVFRMQMLFFDLGTSWLVLKITRIKALGLDANSTTSALLFYTFSAIQAFIVVLYQKFDIFVIFLSLAGIYYLLEKKWFRSAFIFVYCGFFKVYAFLWLAGILVYLLKTRRWKAFKVYLFSTLISGFLQVGIYFIIEGLVFFENLLRFGWHFTVWEEAYNLNWSYYLKYLNIPFLNYLPPLLIIIVLLYYVLFHVKEIDFKFFINSILLLLLIYPSINYHYITWIIPLIGLNLSADSARYRKGLIIYDIVHVNVDQHVFAWLLLLGYSGYIVVKNYLGFGTLVVLVARFVVIIPMLIGLFVFINWEKRGGLGKIQFQFEAVEKTRKET